jgi:hypothetical protein
VPALDPDIRRELRKRLLDQYVGDPDTEIVNELKICGGRSRVDVAVVNGHLGAFEIKSAADRLDRLPSQMAAYSCVFDRLTLVCADGHLHDAVQMLPDHWGVIRAEEGRGRLRLRELRPSSPHEGIDDWSRAQLLWRHEMLDLLTAHGIDSDLRRVPRRKLIDLIVDTVPAAELARSVRDALRFRVRSVRAVAH